MPKDRTKRSARLAKLLTHGSAVVGLRLCFHDHLQESGLSQDFTMHNEPPCKAVKHAHSPECTAFATQEVPRAIAGTPEGRIHICPHGYTEIAVPVYLEGMLAGILFAGPCWCDELPCPYPDLLVAPSHDWLEERRTIVVAIATQIGQILRGDESFAPPDRRTEILNFVNNALDRPLTVDDLAAHLNLSPSRTGHVVQEIFGKTFPRLLLNQRMRDATRLLSTTLLPIGEIAGLVGFDDPNYFSRIFARQYGMPPRAYRKKYRTDA